MSEPSTIEWTLCSDGHPPESERPFQSYLVTFRNPHGRYYVSDAMWIDGQWNKGFLYAVAWAPIPKPWEPTAEQDELLGAPYKDWLNSQ